MKLYEVQLNDQIIYTGTEADAKRVKREMLERENLGPRASVGSITSVEVPTDKQGLIAYLNELVKS